MPSPIPQLHPIASSSLKQGYIFSISPLDSTSTHLVLTHPSPTVSLVDAQTLQLVDTFRDGHRGDVSAIATAVDQDGNGGLSGMGSELWTAGKDGCVIRWDERLRRPGQTIKAFVRKPLPLLSLAYSQRENLIVAGSELVGSDAYILYWDIRRPSEPIYTHTQTHSDDITHLSFLPPTSRLSLPSTSPITSGTPIPSLLLLSSSTDGLVALSDAKENDEDEACWATEGLDGSVAKAGWYSVGERGGKMSVNVWARSDMDSVGTWSLGRGEEALELVNPRIHSTNMFKPLYVSTSTGSSDPTHAHAIIDDDHTRTAEEEMAAKRSKGLKVEYVVDICPSLGVAKDGVGMVGVGNNDGDVVLMHHRTIKGSSGGQYHASAFLRSPADGHKDVVRCMYHDVKSQALYTGSEDSILSGWSIPPGLLRVGDPALDDDGGDGRDAVSSDDEMDEESEIESEEEDEMDVDEEKGAPGKRLASEVWGDGDGRRKR